jgi:2-dehydro-3-deoxy-L-rhamnonate dehydrogenase (NAD+)
MMFESRFRGRTAIVTGGASEFGRSIAARLVSEDAKVSLWDLKEEALAPARTETGAADSHALDIAAADQVARAMEQAWVRSAASWMCW